MSPVFLIILLAAANGEPAANADSSDAPAPVEAEAAETGRFARDEARNWKLFAEGPKRTKLDLHPEPILRWSNPAVGRVYGSVFVWTSAGRPVALASFYRWFSPYTQRTAEFVTLSPDRLSAERHEQQQWAPAAGKIAFQTIPDAPAPDESARKR